MSGARGPADQSLHVGTLLGGYRLLELLGQGYMGVVFRARREEDGESVALKILRDELAGDELYRRRFEREARIASELDNEHVVPVVDFGEASGRLYIAALYVRGVSLSSRIASQGALSLSEAVHLVSDLAGALEALNARGLVHRDVKPANVLVDERGAAALTDFGLARGTAETVLTKTGWSWARSTTWHPSSFEVDRPTTRATSTPSVALSTSVLQALRRSQTRRTWRRCSLTSVTSPAS